MTIKPRRVRITSKGGENRVFVQCFRCGSDELSWMSRGELLQGVIKKNDPEGVNTRMKEEEWRIPDDGMIYELCDTCVDSGVGNEDLSVDGLGFIYPDEQTVIALLLGM